MLKVFSTFTGIGGFEIGIHNAWHDLWMRGEIKSYGQPEVVGYSEIDKYAIKVYEHHFKGVRNYGDITKIEAESLPDFECLVGGFPCQAFSIAGKRGGFADTRGTLFFDLARILRAKQPRLFVFENVKGLVNHDNGKTFRTIITTLDELGYNCQWQVLNSKNFGVPQNRERIIIIGHLRGTPRPQVLPITGSHSQDLKQIKGGSQGNRVYDPTGISSTLASQAGGQGGKTGLYLISKTVRAGGRGSPHGSKQNWDSYEVNGRIRRLTPLECERLQAFPDNWTAVEDTSDTQRYKMCGNAVTTTVIQAIFERILKSCQ